MSNDQSKELVVDNNAQYKMRNELVNSRYRLGVIEQRMIIALASHINKHGDEFEQCMIDANDLAKFMELDSKSAYGQLKRAADTLVKCIVSFEWYKTPKSKSKSWIKANWFDFIYYDAETVTITFKFGSLVKPMLLEVVEAYVKAEAKPIMKFRRSASYRFFNFAVEWKKLKEKAISIDDLKHMLMLDDEYPLYGGLNQKVIAPAIKEINKLTDYEITYIPKKTGRKVTDIVFKVKTKSKIKPKKKDIEADAVPADWTEEQNNMYIELVQLGLLKKDAKMFVSEKPLEEIKISVKYTKKQAAAGKVKDFGAYLYKAIADGYKVAETQSIAREQAAAAAQAADKLACMTTEQKAAYLNHQDMLKQAAELTAEGEKNKKEAAENADTEHAQLVDKSTVIDKIKAEIRQANKAEQERYLVLVKAEIEKEPNAFKRDNYMQTFSDNIENIIKNDYKLYRLALFVYKIRQNND